MTESEKSLLAALRALLTNPNDDLVRRTAAATIELYQPSPRHCPLCQCPEVINHRGQVRVHFAPSQPSGARPCVTSFKYVIGGVVITERK